MGRAEKCYRGVGGRALHAEMQHAVAVTQQPAAPPAAAQPQPLWVKSQRQWLVIDRCELNLAGNCQGCP